MQNDEIVDQINKMTEELTAGFDKAHAEMKRVEILASQIADRISPNRRRWTYYDDVGVFHHRFELPHHGDGQPPRLLDREALDFRVGFMQEELDEFKVACDDGNLHDAADALADLVYVALGTAHMMGLPWDEIWREVQRANMTKVRAASAEESSRGSTLDVVKPPGFRPPDHTKSLINKGPCWISPEGGKD